MSPTFLQIALLGLLQGAAELLPVSSSAHVIVAEKLLGLDPSSPEMTFLLVMLHTGTMFAVIVYFWNAWKESYFASAARFGTTVIKVAVATVATGIVGYGLKHLIEKAVLHGGAGQKAEVEQLFSNLPLIAVALAVAGVLIVVSGLREKTGSPDRDVTLPHASWIGIVQGFCLPFRGFSRSGATISTGLLLDIDKRRAEEFSFALAVVLTPPAIAIELHRLLKSRADDLLAGDVHFSSLLVPGLLGAACAFVAGLLALRFLSSWLEKGRWSYFGYYCLAASAVVFALAHAGY